MDEIENKIARYDDEELLEFFSILPESVIHHIFSFLPFQDIVRTCVLSKAWNRIWWNYPNIDLNLHEAAYKLILPQRRPFLDQVLMILDKCLFRKVCIQKMDIHFSAFNVWMYSPIMHLLLEAAIERNVSELVFKVNSFDSRSWYSLPKEIVVSHSLKVLELDGCKFEDRVPYVDLPHVQELKLLACCFASENALSAISCGCPEMEFLEVSHCVGVGSLLSIPRKSRLKSFTIRCGATEPERIEIFAPSLETLNCSLVEPCSIYLAEGTILKHLGLVGAVLSDEYFSVQHFLSKHLSIEYLRLSNCQGADKIWISSSHLKVLVIHDDDGRFPGAEVDAPNLLCLDYKFSNECSSNNWLCSWNVPKLEEVHMEFAVKNFHSACRGGLKGFLKKLQNYKDLKLFIQWVPEADFIIHEKLHAVSFSSLNKFLKRVKPRSVTISSRRFEHFLAYKLPAGRELTNIFLTYSSRQSIEMLHKKLSSEKALSLNYSELKLVSIDEMDSACKSFVEMHSNGYHSAGIVLVPRSEESLLKRLGMRN